jgi:hypothetical protein
MPSGDSKLRAKGAEDKILRIVSHLPRLQQIDNTLDTRATRLRGFVFGYWSISLPLWLFLLLASKSHVATGQEAHLSAETSWTQCREERNRDIPTVSELRQTVPVLTELT